MGEFFDAIQPELEALRASVSARGPFRVAGPGWTGGAAFGATFGADFSSNATVVARVQQAVNAAGYTPALKVDGAYGPATKAGITWLQAARGLTPSGTIDSALLSALGINAPPPDWVGGWPPDPIKRPSRTVAIATMAAALKQAASEAGYSPSDTLIALMLGQMVGAEGTMPGLWNSPGYTFRGTNNIGAAQVPGGSTGAAFMASHNSMGWGAMAHYDSNPGDPYIGWYYIAPSPIEAARHWIGGYDGVKHVLAQSPQDPQSYATIMYDSRYFTGTTTDRDAEIAKYASAISRALPEVQGAMHGQGNDPSALSVAPEMFASVAARKLTSDLFDKAKAGKSGGTWGYLLPATWDDFVAQNGVVWFGDPPPGAAGTGALGGALVALKSQSSNIITTIKAHPYRTGGIVAGVLAALGTILTFALGGRRG